MGLWGDYEKLVTRINNDESEFFNMGVKYFAIAGAISGAMYVLFAGYQFAGLGAGGIAAFVGGCVGAITGALAFMVLRLAVLSVLVVLPVAVVALILLFTWNIKF